MNKKFCFTRLMALLLIIFTILATGVACKDVEAEKPTDNTPLRVMSYNILNIEWANEQKTPARDRVGYLKNIIDYYKPDVAGIQETCQEWHEAIESNILANSDYAFACKSTFNRTYNLTTIIYNTKKMKLVQEYVFELEQYSDGHVFAVAVFERLSDKKRFVFTNSHPMSLDFEGAAQQYENLIRFAKSEMQKYEGLPFVMTGDFNAYDPSEIYNRLLSEIGVKDARHIADKVDHGYMTFIGWPNGVCKEGKGIDHIFVNNNATVKLFDTVIDHDVEKVSDHVPIYADIILK